MDQLAINMSVSAPIPKKPPHIPRIQEIERGRTTAWAHTLNTATAHDVERPNHPKTLFVTAAPPSKAQVILGYTLPQAIVNSALL